MTDRREPVDELLVERWLRDARTTVDAASPSLDDSWAAGLRALRGDEHPTTEEPEAHPVGLRRHRSHRPVLWSLTLLAAAAAAAVGVVVLRSDLDPEPDVRADVATAPISAYTRFTLQRCDDCGDPGITVIGPGDVYESSPSRLAEVRSGNVDDAELTDPVVVAMVRVLAGADDIITVDATMLTDGRTYVVSMQSDEQDKPRILGTVVAQQSATFDVHDLGNRGTLILAATDETPSTTG